MSYLNGPRINFWGGGSTNVDTANNADNDVVDLISASVTSSDSDDEIIAKLRTHSTNAKGANYYTVAGWNYYGDHQVRFMDATVSSSGAPGAVSTSGDLVGQPVYLLGSVDPQSGEGPYGGPVMVDLDPASSQTTRIYVGGLQIGTSTPALLVRENTLCHSRFLGLRYDPPSAAPPFATPGSVWGNGTFQVAFHKESIVSYDESVTILKDIIEAPGAIGIVVRFSMFEHMPGMSTDDLQANYAANHNDANPSLGRLIGTIGPWFEGEPATCPPGRLLENTKLRAGPGAMVAQGLAYLNAADKRLTLDLVSALQAAAMRQDSTGNTAPIGPNVDYGDLQISAGSGTPVTTPSLPDTYYLFGGLYDVTLKDADQVQAFQGNPISIGSSKNKLVIDESPLRVYSNDRNIYIDDVGGKTTLDLIVTELGGPVAADTAVKLSTSPSGSFPAADFLDFTAAYTVPSGSSSLSVPVSDNGGNAGFVALNFSASQDGGSPSTYFVNFRKYPTDDYSAVIAAGSIPWDTVYEDCLRFYYVLFPAMSKRIPLNSEDTIRAVGAEILKRISDEYRPTTLYMPLTRSMSPGKVALLRAFLGG